MSEYRKPLPRGEGYDGEFYTFCNKHELRFQRCSECRTWRHIPREGCRKCGSLKWSWELSTGRGIVFSWTVSHRALHPGFGDDVPYATVIVELEEGVRIVSQVIDMPIESLEIGAPVEIYFDDVTDEVTLPKFRVSNGKN